MSQIEAALAYTEGDKASCSLNIDVIDAGDITSGTKKDGTQWQKRNFTVKDSTGKTCSVTTWTESLNYLQVGKSYALEGLVRSIYQGNTQLTVGKWTKFTELNTPVFAGGNQQPKQSEDEFFKKRQEELKPQKQPIPIPANKLETIHSTTELLYAINQAVTEKLKEYNPAPAPAMIGQFTKIIYDQLEAQK